MKALLAILLLTSGCTLSTRPLQPHEQAVVAGMAADAGWTEPIRLLQYTRNPINHAPAWMGNTVILGTTFNFDAADNVSRWVVAHEVCHLMQAKREKWWWLAYTLRSADFEAEANEYARKLMEIRR